MSIKSCYVPGIVVTSSTALFGIVFMSEVLADIDWQPCVEMPDSEFECASVYVPLNHQNHIDYSSAYESGESVVRIALARLPAEDSANKKGSLFLNPGGPGGSGVRFLLESGQYLFTDEVRRNYDLVGFDPRGIDRSDELTCFYDINEIDHFYSKPAFPITPVEVNRREELDHYLSGLCGSRGGDIINHMSTADVARDMDLLRQAVGDDKLHFVGYSYGSYLGVTYANLFPEKVGAMVIDSVLDPIAWSTGRGWSSYFFPFTTRLRSAEGAKETLKEFFRLCDESGIEVCELAGNAENRYANVAESIRKEPFVFIDENGSEVILDYASFITLTLRSLYNPETWPLLASGVAAIEENLPLNEIAKKFHVLRNSAGLDNNQPDVLLDQPFEVGFVGVSCSDSDNPNYYENWTWSAEISDSQYNYFGSPWTWSSSICLSWPGSKESRYTDGFSVQTENPVLVVNNLYDPATPYHGAKIVNKLLKNSRLLTVNGWGHPSTFLSACAGNHVADYLLTGRLPEKGASCDADGIPFSTISTVDGSTTMQRSLAETQISDAEKKELHKKLLKEILQNRVR